MKKPINSHTLAGKSGLRAEILDIGATIRSLDVTLPGKKRLSVVLGFSDLEDYRNDTSYMGCLCGRVANRIRQSRFVLDNKPYTLPKNDNGNTLHGGTKGFNKVFFQIVDKTDNALTLSHASPDGDQGFPGNLKVLVTYTLTDDNGLRIDYSATSDQPTPVNLTNHAYFNLNGAGCGDILDHELFIRSDRYLSVTPQLIPDGRLFPVTNTPLDFRTPIAVGSRINEDHPSLAAGRGYDLTYVLDHRGDLSKPIARVKGSQSGLTMEVFTTEPSIQLYTGNFLDGSAKGAWGGPIEHRFGLCLETQNFPDAVNHANFPNSIIKPGDTYRQTAIYRFS